MSEPQPNADEKPPTSATRIGLLLASLTLTLASGFFTAVALGVTPQSFSPKFTGFQNLVSDEITDSPRYIAVTVSTKTYTPTPGWICGDRTQLRNLTSRVSVRPGEMVCLVPDVFTDTPANEAHAHPVREDATTSRATAAATSTSSGPNWAGWTAFVLGLLGVLTAALTQHDKFPWSAASRLARAQAKRSLTDLEETSEVSPRRTTPKA